MTWDDLIKALEKLRLDAVKGERTVSELVEDYNRYLEILKAKQAEGRG
jgi:hypothetical protein